MSRLVALCEGGPLDGQVFSVTEAAPLFSRFTDGVLYVPKGKTDLPEGGLDDHEEAVKYVPAADDEAGWLMAEYWQQFPDLDESGTFIPPEPKDG